jgi:hypothetical protein
MASMLALNFVAWPSRPSSAESVHCGQVIAGLSAVGWVASAVAGRQGLGRSPAVSAVADLPESADRSAAGAAASSFELKRSG